MINRPLFLLDAEEKPGKPEHIAQFDEKLRKQLKNVQPDSVDGEKFQFGFFLFRILTRIWV